MRSRLILALAALLAVAPGLGAQGSPDAAFEAETLRHFQALVNSTPAARRATRFAPWTT